MICAMMLITGCSVQASPEEVSQARSSFVQLVKDLNGEAQSGRGMLGQVRELEATGKVKTLKLLTIISDGQEMNKRISHDVILANIPAELEPYRERVIQSLQQRDKAYQLLFDSYDQREPKLAAEGDRQLEEVLAQLQHIQQDLVLFGK